MLSHNFTTVINKNANEILSNSNKVRSVDRWVDGYIAFEEMTLLMRSSFRILRVTHKMNCRGDIRTWYETPLQKITFNYCDITSHHCDITSLRLGGGEGGGASSGFDSSGRVRFEKGSSMARWDGAAFLGRSSWQWRKVSEPMDKHKSML